MGIDTKLCGSRIRAVRKARKMTAYRLAEIIGLSEVSLTHIECGSRGPSLQTIYNIEADRTSPKMDTMLAIMRALDYEIRFVKRYKGGYYDE